MIESAKKKDFAIAGHSIFAKISGALRLSLKNENLRKVYAISFSLGLGVFGFFSYWQPEMQSVAGWDTGMFGAFFALVSIAIIIGYRISHGLKPSFRNAGLLLFGMSILMLLLSSVNAVFVLAAAILAWELLWGIYTPIESTIVNQNTPSDIRATSISVNAMAFRLSWVVFGVAIFFLGADKPRLFWTIGALFLFIGALIALTGNAKIHLESR